MRLQDLLICVRLIKQSRDSARPAIPSRLLGMLAQIDDLPSGCHARELVARTSLDASTVSRVVNALVARGLVARWPDQQDGRASVLGITPAGRAALAETREWITRVFDRALADWPEGQITALSAALDRFARDIETSLSHETMEAAR